MKLRVLILTFLFPAFFISIAAAAWGKKPEIRWSQLYRYDSRQEDHQLYTNRLSAAFIYKDKQQKELFKIAPFFEARRNIDKNLWERKELGVEIGKDICPWLYLGEAIQKGWMEEDYRYYSRYEKRDYVESETRLLLSHNLLSNKHITLKGFLLDEYTYDFDRGKGMRNEFVIGIVMPVGQHIEVGINWRHIDRICCYDSDTCEASVTLIL